MVIFHHGDAAEDKERREEEKKKCHRLDYHLALGSIQPMKSLSTIISRGRSMAKKLNLISFLKLISTNVNHGN